MVASTTSTETTRMEQPYTPTPSTGCKDRGGEPSIVTIPFVVLVVLLIVAVIVIVILVVCLCRQRSHRSDGVNGAGVILNTRVKARGQGIALYVTPANTQHVPIGPPERHTWGSPQNDLSAVSSGHYEEMDFSLPVGKKVIDKNQKGKSTLTNTIIGRQPKTFSDTKS